MPTGICSGLMELARSTPCLPETPHHQTHELPMAGPFLGIPTHPMVTLGHKFDSKQSPQLMLPLHSP